MAPGSLDPSSAHTLVSCYISPTQGFDRYGSSAAAEAEALAEALAAARRGWWQVAAAHFLTTAWHLTRLTWLLLLFAPVFISAPLALSWGLYRPEWMELLRKTLEAAGAFFIKWGQWSATRHDIFPPDMCKELSLLQTQVGLGVLG